MDSTSGCDVGVNVSAQDSGQGSLVLDNYSVSSGVAVKSGKGDTLLAGSVRAGETWVLGNE